MNILEEVTEEIGWSHQIQFFVGGKTEEGDRPPSEIGRWRLGLKIGYKIFNNFFRKLKILSADKKVHLSTYS